MSYRLIKLSLQNLAQLPLWRCASRGILHGARAKRLPSRFITRVEHEILPGEQVKNCLPYECAIELGLICNATAPTILKLCFFRDKRTSPACFDRSRTRTLCEAGRREWPMSKRAVASISLGHPLNRLFKSLACLQITSTLSYESAA